MLLLLFVLQIEPQRVIDLPAEFNSVTVYNGVIYLAPFIGKSIYRCDPGRIEPLQFSELGDYRIRDFRITPFAVYFNDGRKIEKLYLSSGHLETIYEGDDISSFAITPAGEIVIADRGERELVFLDFRNAVKVRKDNIYAIDVEYDNDRVYCLTGPEVVVLDEFSNVIETMKLETVCERIVLDSAAVYVFSAGRNVMYRADNEAKAIEFPERIRGAAFGDSIMVLLTSNGTAIHIYYKPGR
jgi:hypothetical protein